MGGTLQVGLDGWEQVPSGGDAGGLCKPPGPLKCGGIRMGTRSQLFRLSVYLPCQYFFSLST